MSFITDNITKIATDIAIAGVTTGFAIAGDGVSYYAATIILEMSGITVAKDTLGFIIWVLVGIGTTVAVLARSIEAISSAQIKSSEERMKSYERDQKRLETIAKIDELYATAEIVGIMSEEELDVILLKLKDSYSDLDERKAVLSLIKARLMRDDKPSILRRISNKVKIFMLKFIV